MEGPLTDVASQLEEVEELAEHLLINKDEIVQLDKRRNKNREALRALSKAADTSSNHKTWMCFGNMFLKFPTPTVKEFITKDQSCIDEEIEKLRNNIKQQVGQIRDLEGKPELKGFDLKPLTKEETSAIYQIAN